MSAAKRMAHIVASRNITPASVLKHLNGEFSSYLVHRCTRSITKKYGELRKEIRDHNESLKGKSIKVSKAAIWNYMLKGKTTSEKLLLLNKTNPAIGQVMDVCIHFCDMIHNKEGAPVRHL